MHQQKLSESRGASPTSLPSRKSSSGYQSGMSSAVPGPDPAPQLRVHSAGNSPTSSTPLISAAGGDGVSPSTIVVTKSTSPESCASLRSLHHRRLLELPDSDQGPPGGPPPVPSSVRCSSSDVIKADSGRSSNSPEQFLSGSSTGSRSIYYLGLTIRLIAMIQFSIFILCAYAIPFGLVKNSATVEIYILSFTIS